MNWYVVVCKCFNSFKRLFHLWELLFPVLLATIIILLVLNFFLSIGRHVSNQNNLREPQVNLLLSMIETNFNSFMFPPDYSFQLWQETNQIRRILFPLRLPIYIAVFKCIVIPIKSNFHHERILIDLFILENGTYSIKHDSYGFLSFS